MVLNSCEHVRLCISRLIEGPCHFQTDSYGVFALSCLLIHIPLIGSTLPPLVLLWLLVCKPLQPHRVSSPHHHQRYITQTEDVKHEARNPD
jgi:hypothetical protein